MEFFKMIEASGSRNDTKIGSAEMKEFDFVSTLPFRITVYSQLLFFCKKRSHYMLLLGSYTINISGRFPPTKYKIQVKDVSFPDNNQVLQRIVI